MHRRNLRPVHVPALYVDDDPPRVESAFLRPWKNGPHRGSAVDILKADVAKVFNQKQSGTRSALVFIFRFKENRDELIEQVMSSLDDPFQTIWKLRQANDPRVNRPSSKDCLKLKSAEPWSIVCYRHPVTGSVIQTVVYGDDGNAIAHVDFPIGKKIHLHGLEEDGISHPHESSPNHSFPLEAIPWPWLCVPLMEIRRGEKTTTPQSTQSHPQGEMNWRRVLIPSDTDNGDDGYETDG